MPKKLYRRFAFQMLKDHLIVFAVTLIFVLFFGNFLSPDRPIWGLVFSSLTLIGYMILIVADVTAFARRDFLNAKGDLSQLNPYMGFICGAFAQIPGLLMIFVIVILNFFNYQAAAIANFVFRTWMIVYMSFFPTQEQNLFPYALYLSMLLIPVLATGITYYVGLRRSKVYLRK